MWSRSLRVTPAPHPWCRVWRHDSSWSLQQPTTTGHSPRARRSAKGCQVPSWQSSPFYRHRNRNPERRQANCSQPVAYTNSLNCHNSPMRRELLPPFYRGENQDRDRLGNLARITQQASDGAAGNTGTVAPGPCF